MTTPVDDDFTELVDPNITRVDIVDRAANGTTILIAKREDSEQGGLFDPEFVRDLVTKSDGEAQPAEESVTVTGSPAAIARMMKQAAERASVRKSEREQYVEFVKAKYSAEDKRKLAAQGHAMHGPGGEPDYPIDDKEDLAKAINAVGRGGADHDKIRAYIIRRAREMGHADMIPDNWASDGSLKQPVSKADAMTDPGSPAWETQDADTADGIVQAILALRPRLQAFAAREGAEVAAGEMGDLGDVFDLQAARDCLMQAAKLVGGVAVAERAESGALAKASATTPAAHAAPNPQESTVTNTDNTGVREGEQAATTGTEQAAVAKSAFGLTEAELAEIGRRALIKKAAKAAAKQTSGATAAPEDVRVIPGTETVQAPAQVPDDNIAKAMATQFATALGEAMAPVVKQVENLTTLVGSQSERVEKALAQPDDRRSPLLNGANGEPMLADRGANSPANSPAFQEIRKALDALPDGPAKEEAQRKVALAAIKARFGNS